MTSKKGVSTGIVIGIVFIVAIVFGAGMYLYANNKAAKENENLNAQITELQNKISDAKVTAPIIKNDSAQPIASQDSSDLILSGIKLAIPSNWKIEDKSDKGIMAEIPGIKSPINLSIEKCNDSSDFSCFGSARSDFRKTSWGGIYALASTANIPSYGLEFDNLDNNKIKSMNLYIADAAFEDYQPSDKDIDMISNVLKSASLVGK